MHGGLDLCPRPFILTWDQQRVLGSVDFWMYLRMILIPTPVLIITRKESGISSSVCVSPHLQGILYNTSWVSHNSTEFWHYLPGNSIGSHGLRSSPIRLALSLSHQIQTPISSPDCHLCFRQTCYRLEVPVTLSLGLINLLECLIELRKHLLMFTSLLKIC